jgi:hypothetical protein
VRRDFSSIEQREPSEHFQASSPEELGAVGRSAFQRGSQVLLKTRRELCKYDLFDIEEERASSGSDLLNRGFVTGAGSFVQAGQLLD